MGILKNWKNKREYYYYSYFLKYQSFNYYLKIYNADDNISVPFKFLNNTNLHAFSKKDIIKRFGRSEFSQYSETNKQHFILFYSIKYSKYDILKSFHFLNNNLFFINLTFQQMNDDEKNKILNKIYSIYNIDSKKPIEYKIVDSEDNILFIEDIFELSVNYLIPNTDCLNNRYEEIKERALNIENNENLFLENLFNKIL